MYQALKKYKRARWKLPSDWKSREAFNRALLSLNKTSSPGIPYCKEKPTNGDWLQWDGVQADPFQAERLWNDVQDVFNGTYKHRFRAFVKKEMHTAQKASEKRWRLILASSLPVQVAWQMLFSYQNDILNDRVGDTPSFQGYIPIAGGWKRLRRLLKENKMRTCLDKSGWDVNAPGWVFKLALRLRWQLCENQDLEWLDIAERLYADAYENSVITLPGGETYQQEIPGFMKSGLVNTISDNSFAQFFLHAGACLRLGRRVTKIIATGDDTVQEDEGVDEEYLIELQRLGCIIKEVVYGLQFMGFDHEDFTPMYPHKHIANALHQDERYLKDTLEAYMAWYAHHPYYHKWKKIAQQLGYTTPSLFEVKYWLDDPRSQDD